MDAPLRQGVSWFAPRTIGSHAAKSGPVTAPHRRSGEVGTGAPNAARGAESGQSRTGSRRPASAAGAPGLSNTRSPAGTNGRPGPADPAGSQLPRLASLP